MQFVLLAHLGVEKCPLPGGPFGTLRPGRPEFSISKAFHFLQGTMLHGVLHRTLFLVDLFDAIGR